jgi:hypothetical protein
LDGGRLGITVGFLGTRIGSTVIRRDGPGRLA